MTLAHKGCMEQAVIIGAGLAGAAAALSLAKSGFVPLVIEARDRVGGRAYSRPFVGAQDGAPLEYGGSWITPAHHRIRSLAAELGLGLRPRAPLRQRLAFRGAGTGLPSFESAAEREAHEAVLARIAMDAAFIKKGHAHDEQGRPLSSLSYKTYLDRLAPPVPTRHLLDAWWTVSGSGAHEEVAASEFLSSCAYGGGLAERMIDVWSDTVEPGMETLASRMLADSGARVRLSSPVTAITQDNQAVTIAMANGEKMSAAQVILALGINQMSAIRFEPALPPLAAQAVARGHGGRAFKLWIRARGIPVGTLITGNSEGIELLLAERRAADGTVLLIGFGLQLGNAAPGDATWVQSEFCKLAPNAEFLGYDWHDWINDPFARGTWVSARADCPQAFEAAAWQPQGRLAFASSDYAPEQAGWFEGAVISGEAAAAWLLQRQAGEAHS